MSPQHTSVKVKPAVLCECVLDNWSAYLNHLCVNSNYKSVAISLLFIVFLIKEKYIKVNGILLTDVSVSTADPSLVHTLAGQKKDTFC